MILATFFDREEGFLHGQPFLKSGETDEDAIQVHL